MLVLQLIPTLTNWLLRLIEVGANGARLRTLAQELVWVEDLCQRERDNENINPKVWVEDVFMYGIVRQRIEDSNH